MQDIEYFYSTHSAFAYLGSRKLHEIAAAQGRSITHRPILLAPVLEAAKSPVFAGRSPEHIAYFFGREIERWSEYRNAPTLGHVPTTHRQPLELSSGLVISAMQAGHNVNELVHALHEGHWLRDADLSDHSTLAGIANSVGIDPALLDQAMSDEIQDILLANTREAAERSVFGSPTYFIDGDMFYGQDRLELIERTLSKPFAAPSWGAGEPA